MMFFRIAFPVVVLALLAANYAQESGQAQELPACKDVHGQAVDWSNFDDQAIVLMFHKPGMKFSERAMRELASKYKEDPAIAHKSALVVINFSTEDSKPIVDLLEDLQVAALVIPDPQRQAFDGYRVIAFPTAFVLDRQRHLVQVIKGYGPHFVSRTLLAGRFGSGSIDQASYQRLLDGIAKPGQDPEIVRLKHFLIPVRQLAADGKINQAMQMLTQKMGDVSQPESDSVNLASSPYLEALELKVRLHIQLDQLEQAVQTRAQLQKFSPTYAKLFLLDAHLALAKSDLAAAESALQGSRSRLFPEAVVLRARILAATGKFEQACELMSQPLERLVWLGKLSYQ